MHFAIYGERLVTWSEFIDFWSSWYRKYDEDGERPDSKFLQHLRWPRGRLTETDVDFLFEWKNLMRLSEGKGRVVQRVKDRLGDFNDLRGRALDEILPLAEGCTDGFVWQRFICHVTSPELCPIWDANVLRAFQILASLPDRPDERDKDGTYIAYRDYFAKRLRETPAKQGVPPFRRLDQALFAFGKHYPLV